MKDLRLVILSSNQTCSMLRTDQEHRSVSSQNKDLIVNEDGSVDFCFGPILPEGKVPDRVQTVPGQTRIVILRIYGPLEPWFDKSWRTGEIEPL